ncbi:unnamed protein product [Eruca vesicaria subsp. sativa]|uniref:Trichome birefringence-like C-terminal domain-containing protein n=1 Tax=Eruca vesicaria subsp. sativa TaxID=29727 RepID=A0ABC8J8F9_ERUVS|nr:unnamed protein product [Eruca vesicaria subsp. sativa]
MASDAVKYTPIHNGTTTTKTAAAAEIKSFFSALKPRKTSTFAYAFLITFVSFTLFFAFSPSTNSSSPWFSNIFSSSSSFSTTTTASSSSDNTSGSHVSSIFSYIIPNATLTKPANRSSDVPVSVNSTVSDVAKNTTLQALAPENRTPVTKNVTFESQIVKGTDPVAKNSTLQAPAPENLTPAAKNVTFESPIVKGTDPVVKNSTLQARAPENRTPVAKNTTFESPVVNGTDPSSQPLFPAKSPTGSSNQTRTTGDVGNKTSTQSPSKAHVSVDLTANSTSSTASTPKKQISKGDSVSLDYNCTVEFFVSPFLVQETEIIDKKGTKKETLRLDLVGKSSEQYKGADIIVFNTGHWWTHEKTSKGEDYYQEGSNVYHELAVLEAFRKALTTWGRWVEKNVNPNKSLVFFRGYSASHFSGGQWNSGGACDSETEPIKNETYLTPYPAKMKVLERVLKGMRTPVTYLNITRLTDYRKDGHPSVYRKHSLSDKEKKTPLLYQDCSHWCLPGVPDSWNEILYAELLVKLNQLGQTRRNP